MYTTVSYLLTRLPELDDRHAWSIFDDRYSQILKKYFLYSSCNLETARDLAQDTIARVIEGLRKGAFQRDRGRFRDWIKGIARNVLRNHLRAGKLLTNADEVAPRFWSNRIDGAAGAASDTDFDAIWVRARLSQLIRVAAEQFSVEDLRCYFQLEVRKLSIDKVAQRNGIAKRNVYRKRRKVADWMLAAGPRFMAQWER